MQMLPVTNTEGKGKADKTVVLALRFKKVSGT